MACGWEDFTCDPFAEFPCVWFGASENSVVKTRFVDYREVSDLTPHFGGLGFGDFIIIKTTGHSFCFGIPENLRDILCYEPRFPVFHQNTDFGSVEVEDFRRFRRSSICEVATCAPPIVFFQVFSNSATAFQKITSAISSGVLRAFNLSFIAE